MPGSLFHCWPEGQSNVLVLGCTLWTKLLHVTQKSRGFKSGDRAGQSLPWMDLFDTTRSPRYLSRCGMFLSLVWYGVD